MNRLFGVVLALLASMTISLNAIAMGPEHTGSWYNQSESGHGFSIEYGDAGNGTPLVVVYWYVYNKDGYPMFFTGYGYPDQNGVDIIFSAHWGMKFGEFNPITHSEADGGVARFTFQDANNGTFEYVPSEFSKQNFGHIPHQTPITKLFGVTHPDSQIIEVPIYIENAVVSQVRGSFSGFGYGNNYELTNGQIWQQTEFYTWFYTWIQPDVVIYAKNGSTYLSVEGIAEHVQVKQVR